MQVAIGTDLATALRALRELDEVHRPCESPPKKRRKVEAEEMKGGAGRFDGSEIPNNHLKRIQPRKIMGYVPYQLVIAGFFVHQQDEERGEASRYHAFFHQLSWVLKSIREHPKHVKIETRNYQNFPHFPVRWGLVLSKPQLTKKSKWTVRSQEAPGDFLF